MGGRKMEWAGRPIHLGGIPRTCVFNAVGAFAKFVGNFLNSTTVHNAETLIRLVRSRPSGVPLITVSNHMSTLDDPVMWGFKGFPTEDAKLARWVLAAEDICFKNSIMTYFFRLGKCIPITRGAGIYQEHMNEALDRLSEGAWVMPEKAFFGRRPPFPLCNKDIKIVVGEPIEFDLPKLRETAMSMSGVSSFPGWPAASPHRLDDAVRKWLYISISEQIQTVMESLRGFSNTLFRLQR
ncbi:N-acylphosphatidylethanolamine synthase isoform X1 [Macadamia integrifolia]|uniref:N-acylphosphatidylethanolamine synthase isoform X1 n=1 Tax=Macadamia integrifolia TaxID=60698 RepID=UPI001C4EB560|nr:N-acylphosphatidylethanolamine synthase isoform X1 [Macadamia integrifolia]